MTREEQILKLIDEENGIENYGTADYQVGVLDGARLADEHPKNVWHDANEKPHAKKWLLVQLDKDDYKILYLKDLYIDLWCDWCKIFNFIRWAYIDDLLPKGGKK